MYKIYRIEPNDTLETIAKKSNTTIDDIKNINGIDDTFVAIPGNFIIIPRKNVDIFNNYTVKKGDSIYSISKEFGVDPNTILLINGLEKEDHIYPNQQLLIPTPGLEVYVTKQGDTINTVSKALEVEPLQLLVQNRSIYLLPDQLLVFKQE